MYCSVVSSKHNVLTIFMYTFQTYFLLEPRIVLFKLQCFYSQETVSLSYVMVIVKVYPKNHLEVFEKVLSVPLRSPVLVVYDSLSSFNIFICPS